MGAILTKYGTALTFDFPILKAGTSDFATSADWTPAAGDLKATLDGANVGNLTNLPVAVGGTGSALWRLTLTAGELTGKRLTIQIIDAATKVVADQAIILETYGHASAQHAFDFNAPLGASEVTAACVAAFLVTLTEAYAAKGAAGSVRDLLYEAIALLENYTKSGTVLTAFKRDGTTAAMTYTLDNADQPSSITRAT